MGWESFGSLLQFIVWIKFLLVWKWWLMSILCLNRGIIWRNKKWGSFSLDKFRNGDTLVDTKKWVWSLTIYEYHQSNDLGEKKNFLSPGLLFSWRFFFVNLYSGGGWIMDGLLCLGVIILLLVAFVTIVSFFNRDKRFDMGQSNPVNVSNVSAGWVAVSVVVALSQDSCIHYWSFFLKMSVLIFKLRLFSCPKSWLGQRKW